MSKLSDTIADLRKSYEQAEHDENQSSDRPLRQFELWLDQAIEALSLIHI